MAETPTLKPKRKLPSWVWYAGAGVAIGGAYFLYKKKQNASAASSAPTMTQPTTNVDTSAQQPSVVPYYLTAGGGNNSGYGNGTLTGGLPQPVPQGSTGTPVVATGDQSSAVLPPIPPILPTNPVAPVPPSAPPPAPIPTPPSPPPTPAPPPQQQVANLPPDLLAKIQAGGEQIIGNLIDPVTGGTWWFGSKGGVFAVNGARFLGSARNYGFDDPSIRTAVQAIPLGNGYRIISSRGETYNFPS